MGLDNGIRVELLKDFGVVRETLERIGVCNREKKVITPSAYLLHKEGRYFVVHFKCLLSMDGFRDDVDARDISRQAAIASMLQNWGMVRILDDGVYQDPLEQRIFVLPYKDKQAFTINHKYRIGGRDDR